MRLATRERVVHLVATIVVVAAAVGALLTGDDLQDLELTLVMVTAVVAGLVCFDTSMERRLRSFGPWLLLSFAPAAKTAPMVWQELRADSGASFERYDHAGSLLFAGLVFAAVTVLATSSTSLGARTARFDRSVIFGSAIVAALAGASVAFLFDRDFGSETAGRVLETPTWFFIGGVLAALLVAASRSRDIPAALTGVLLTAAFSVALLAVSVAGRDFDRGWWAVVFAVLTVSAATTSGELGSRDERDRLTSVPVAVALVAGAVAATAAITARSDATSWGPGWALLGLLSLAMFGLAITSTPLEEQRRSQLDHGIAGRPDRQDIGIEDSARAVRAKQRALARLEEEAAQPPGAVTAAADTPSGGPSVGDSVAPRTSEGATLAAAAAAAAASPEPAAGAAKSATATPTAEQPSRAANPTAAAGAAEEPAARPDQPSPAPSSSLPRPEPAATSTTRPSQPSSVTSSSVPLSDGSIVASARAAAEIRTAPSADRHSLAPLDHAHHFDPSTGLLSAAGLQHAIARAFDVPRQAGHVTIMMFMVRDLDTIEQQHGRLASAAVTREVAERIRTLMPEGTGARFARSAYAIVFVGDLSDSQQTIQRLARVLLQLRAPVEGGTLGDKIDVVAGMAQCYDREHPAQFVERANAGLARAVRSPEPTFVAMP